MGHHPNPSSQSQSDSVALMQIPTAACASSCCRFEIWGWATTQMKPSSSSTVVGHVPASAPTTISLLVTCYCLVCSLSQHPNCGTTHPAAGPLTMRTWLSSTTRIAGTRWRNFQLRAAAVRSKELGEAGEVRSWGCIMVCWQLFLLHSKLTYQG